MSSKVKSSADRGDGTALVPRLRFPEFQADAGWDTRQLAEVCSRITQGGTPDTSEPKNWGGAINWMTPAEMGKTESPFISETNRKITEEGLRSCASELLPVNSVILSVRAPIGHLAINTVPMSINQGCKGLVVGKNLDFYFLYCSMARSKKHLIDLGAGNTFKELSSSTLKRFVIPIPSLHEQQKIADCLDSVDAMIVAQGRKVEALKAHKKGLMQQLFPQEGETRPRLRFPEFERAGEWSQTDLGRLIEIKGRIGYRGYTVEDIVNAGEGAIALSPSNISETGSLSFEKATFISWFKYNESPEIMVEKGQTLLVKTGSTYGKSAFVRDLPQECTVNPQIVVLKPISVDPYFLSLLIAGEGLQNKIEANVVGGAIPTLSQDSISKFKVLVPKISEQRRIADCLTSLDDLITAEIQKLDTIKTHKKGLMQQLFPQVGEDHA